MAENDFTHTQELVGRAKDGDDQALNRLLDRYANRVRRVVRVHMGAKLRRSYESGDVVQDVMITALRKIHDFEMHNEAAWLNFLSKIAEHRIHEMVDHMHAQKRDIDRSVPMDAPQGPDASAGEGAALDLPDGQLDPGEIAAEEEEHALVDRMVSQLAEKHRQLVFLRDYLGKSWQEIADETGRPTADAARVAYPAALAELARLVKSACSEDGGTN